MGRVSNHVFWGLSFCHNDLECDFQKDQKKEEAMPTEGEKSPETENNNKKSKTGGSQDSQPSPLALLAATCSKIGTPGENQATGQQQIIIDPSQGLVQLQNQPQQLELVTTQLAGNSWQLVAAAPPASKENNVAQQGSSVTSSTASPSSSNNGSTSPSKTKSGNSAAAANPGQFQVVQVQNPSGSVQYQVIPQIQTTEGQQIQINPANATALQDLQGQIQLIPAGNNQAILATANRTASGNIIAQNIGNQTVPVQIRPGVSIPLQLQTIPGTQAQVVTTVPINIGGVTLALPVINNVSASGGSGQVGQTADNGVSNGNQVVSTPVTTASVSTMPESPSSSSTCTTAASTSLTSSDTLVSSAEAGQYASTAGSSSEPTPEESQTNATESEAQSSSQLQPNGLQNVQDQSSSLQQVQIVGQPILQQIQIQQPQQQIIQAIPPQSFQLQSGQTIQTIQQQPLQNVQLQAVSPTQVLIRAPTLTPSGQISWQTVQVQNLQSLSNLQVQNAGLPQQLTITPVSSSGGATIAQIAPVAVAGTPITLNAAQLASVPNLQTVSVASLSAAGVQVQGVPVTITSVAAAPSEGPESTGAPSVVPESPPGSSHQPRPSAEHGPAPGQAICGRPRTPSCSPPSGVSWRRPSGACRWRTSASTSRSKRWPGARRLGGLSCAHLMPLCGTWALPPPPPAALPAVPPPLAILGPATKGDHGPPDSAQPYLPVLLTPPQP
ncbi:transcription factor Sp4 isoform X3 [Carettochelys insculpta]|uniref:transcription factor Sp4 isoform X3 n=1 Tax=Carettochelys insculpta TaxID=44489 RepID=UPI003EBB1906